MNDFLPHPCSHARRCCSNIIPRPLHWLRRSPSRSAMIKCICHCAHLIRTLSLKEGAPPFPRPPFLRKGLQPVNRLFCTRKQALAHKGLLVVIDATELRVFYAIGLRLFDARCARVCAPRARGRKKMLIADY